MRYLIVCDLAIVVSKLFASVLLSFRNAISQDARCYQMSLLTSYDHRERNSPAQSSRHNCPFRTSSTEKLERWLNWWRRLTPDKSMSLRDVRGACLVVELLTEIRINVFEMNRRYRQVYQPCWCNNHHCWDTDLWVYPDFGQVVCAKTISQMSHVFWTSSILKRVRMAHFLRSAFWCSANRSFVIWESYSEVAWLCSTRWAATRLFCLAASRACRLAKIEAKRSADSF